MYHYILLKIKIQINEEDSEVPICSCNNLIWKSPTYYTEAIIVSVNLCDSVCTVIAGIDLVVANRYILVYRAQRLLTSFWRDTWYSISVALVLSVTLLQCPYLYVLFLLTVKELLHGFITVHSWCFIGVWRNTRIIQ